MTDLTKIERDQIGEILSRRARTRAAAIEAKHYAAVPVDEPDEPESFDGGPTCPSCGAEVPPDEDECWMCGEEL